MFCLRAISWCHIIVRLTFDEGVSFDILRKTQHRALVVSIGNLKASVKVRTIMGNVGLLASAALYVTNGTCYLFQ